MQQAVAFRRPLKTRQLGAVADGGNDQRAVGDEARVDLSPGFEPFATKVSHDCRCCFGLALGRDHRPRPTAGRSGERLGALLDQANTVAGADQRQRLP